MNGPAAVPAGAPSGPQAARPRRLCSGQRGRPGRHAGRSSAIADEASGFRSWPGNRPARRLSSGAFGGWGDLAPRGHGTPRWRGLLPLPRSARPATGYPVLPQIPPFCQDSRNVGSLPRTSGRDLGRRVSPDLSSPGSAGTATRSSPRTYESITRAVDKGDPGSRGSTAGIPRVRRWMRLRLPGARAHGQLRRGARGPLLSPIGPNLRDWAPDEISHRFRSTNAGLDRSWEGGAGMGDQGAVFLQQPAGLLEGFDPPSRASGAREYGTVVTECAKLAVRGSGSV